MTNSDIVQKLWNLCDVLRDDGINYSDYVTELVLLLFIKMEYEQVKNNEDFAHKLPEGARWPDLSSRKGDELLEYYRLMLTKLAENQDQAIATIYLDAQTRLKEAHHLEHLIKSLDGIDWFSARKDGLGDLYEGLLEKNASETKSGAGQYFTPRPLIDCIINCIKPSKGESIQDPAAGTAGFLIAADAYMKSRSDRVTVNAKRKKTQEEDSFIGVELVPGTRRLALMNALLHGIENKKRSVIVLGNALGEVGAALPKADIILSNPPFGTAKGGGGPTRSDLPYKTSNKQLSFLQHIYLGLKPGGRAAVVLPDNVLFESGIGTEVRRDLLDRCNLHTVLRLPTGIFYAHGVKTNVLFFQKGSKSNPLQQKGCTERVWFYDMRSGMPSFGKRTPFGTEQLLPFELAYGADENGASPRAENVDGIGINSRFRVFSRQQISEKADSLDITWLPNSGTLHDDESYSPEILASEVMSELTQALSELDQLMQSLGASDEADIQKNLLADALGLVSTREEI